jgi:hypothetical protein
MQEFCHCLKKLLDVEDATYFVRGRPCCSRSCYNMAIADDNRALQRAEATTRIVAIGGGKHVVIG